MDLGLLDTVSACEKSVEIELQHPATGEPLGVFIAIKGKDCPEATRLERARANKNIQKMQAGKQFSMTVESQEDYEVELLTVCTTGWRSGDVPSITYNSKPLEFNVPNCLMLYRSRPWARNQIEAAHRDIGLFFQENSPN